MKRILVATVAAVALASPALAQQPGQQDRQDQSQMNGGAGQGKMEGAQKQGAQKQSEMSGHAGSQATMSVDQLSQDQIRVLQQALNDQGKSIEVDGKWGPRTQAALREFNRAQNIEGGRELSSQTLAALGLDPTTFSSGTTGQGGRSGPSASDPGMSGSGSGSGASDPDMSGSGGGNQSR